MRVRVLPTGRQSERLPDLPLGVKYYQARSDYNGGPLSAAGYMYTDRDGGGPSREKFNYTLVKPYTSVITSDPPRDFKLGRYTARVSPAEVYYDVATELFGKRLHEVYEGANPQPAENSAVSNATETGNLLTLVTAMEAKSTYLLIKNVFVRFSRALLQLYRAFKKGRFGRAADILSELWLELRYAWRPLIGEVEALGRLYRKVTIPYLKSSYGGKRYDSDFTISDIITFHQYFGGLTYKAVTEVDIYNLNYKTGFNYFDKIDSRNSDIWAQLGLDLDSIASTVWDLQPLSFVFDFVFNIGELLASADLSAEIVSLNGYETITAHARVRTRLSNVMMVPDWETSIRYWLAIRTGNDVSDVRLWDFRPKFTLSEAPLKDLGKVVYHDNMHLYPPEERKFLEELRHITDGNNFRLHITTSLGFKYYYHMPLPQFIIDTYTKPWNWGAGRNRMEEIILQMRRENPNQDRNHVFNPGFYDRLRSDGAGVYPQLENLDSAHMPWDGGPYTIREYTSRTRQILSVDFKSSDPVAMPIESDVLFTNRRLKDDFVMKPSIDLDLSKGQITDLVALTNKLVIPFLKKKLAS